VIDPSFDLLRVPAMLADAGASKITFVGGEPFLHPNINELIHAAKDAGLVTSAVTNGSLLTKEKLKFLAPVLDWIAFSVDSSSDRSHSLLGRGLANEVGEKGKENLHLQRVKELWPVARDLGIKLKLNTVVTSATLSDDMSALAISLRPERWKVFQVLPVEGQNSGKVEPLLISEAQFQDGWKGTGDWWNPSASNLCPSPTEK
jgi:radical S-adenosyl methionine domain-containing protein 2